MHANERVQLSVEAPQERVRLIRVVGALDRAAVASLLRLVDAQLALISARRCRVTDLFVDLEGVSSFEPGGLEVLRQARHSTGTRGIGLHLTGCSARFHLLPLRARQLLAAFNTFPTIEVGLTAMADAPLEPATDTPAVSSAGQIHDGPGDLVATSAPPSRPPLTAADLPAPRRPADPTSGPGAEAGPASESALPRRSGATTLPRR